MINPESNLRKGLALFLIMIMLNSMVGCHYYYSYQSDAVPSIEKLNKLKSSPNYIIVHQNDQAFNLANVRVDQQGQVISGELVQLPPDHLKYRETKSRPGSPNRYLKKDKGKNIGTPAVVNEVHIYVKDLSLHENEVLTIPLNLIEKIEVYDADTGATTASFILGGVLITVGTITLIGIIILLTKSSCPFVYVNNGKEYVFAGEIYSGAIFRSIERDDYLSLPKIMSDSLLEIKVANKLKEKQYINTLDVLQVSHPAGTTVLTDRHGQMHLVDQPVKMTKAMVDDLEITALLQHHDSINFEFNAETGKDFYNDIILTFPKKSMATEGHLVMHTKNSLWGDYLFGEFTKLFGSRYSSWIEKQNKKPSAETAHWAVDQGLVMKVFIENNEEWILTDTVDLVGPLAYRDVVVPIDLKNHKSETVNIKLSAGFMMWDLDYVAMDYSIDSGIQVKQLTPSQAMTNRGKDALASLKVSDRDYLAQETTGDEVTVSFPLSHIGNDNLAYDYILHSRGYYQHVRDYEGSPALATLLSFKLQGRFSRFSKEKYDELNQLLQVAEISASINK